uniref:Uncharacterized protein n=1 Tax=Saimiri boliviensis boliviensis TaxID=39432 RepID=A0A2K6TC56_SAIBB
FLPLFPVKVKTQMVAVIGAAVLLLDLLGLLLLGQLLMFHIYLSTSPAAPNPPRPPSQILCRLPSARVHLCSRSASARNEIMGKKGKSQEEMKSVRPSRPRVVPGA